MRAFANLRAIERPIPRPEASSEDYLGGLREIGRSRVDGGVEGVVKYFGEFVGVYLGHCAVEVENRSK